MKKTICINAGHFWNTKTKSGDAGVVYGDYKEVDIVRNIRDYIVENKPEWEFVPDELNIRSSIDWAKQHEGDVLFLDIHLNSHSNKNIRGIEVYHYNSEEKAQELAEKIAENLNIPCREAKPDTQSFVGQLGWCRELGKNAFVVEVLYLSNEQDRVLITTSVGQRKVANSIINAIEPPQNEVKGEKDNLLLQLFNWLKRYFALIKKNK